MAIEGKNRRFLSDYILWLSQIHTNSFGGYAKNSGPREKIYGDFSLNNPLWDPHFFPCLFHFTPRSVDFFEAKEARFLHSSTQKLLVISKRYEYLDNGMEIASVSVKGEGNRWMW